MPQVSIIIPAYNAERTILETRKSVQKQTFQNFELIVINDGSKDRTLELLQDIKDDRLKVFSHENGGVCVARNRGISNATGEFIAFLDSDLTIYSIEQFKSYSSSFCNTSRLRNPA